jgi:hypothetical protein
MVTRRRLYFGGLAAVLVLFASGIRVDAQTTSLDANLVVVGRDAASVGPIKGIVRCAAEGSESSVTTDADVVLRVGSPTKLDDVLGRARAASPDRKVTCSLQTVDVAAGSVEYLTTQPIGADGVRPAALPGRVSSTGFRSTPASAGQSITASLRFTGDLSIAARSADASSSGGSVGLSLRCRDSAVNETFRLRAGERRVRTGITAGTICTLSADVTGVRFDDTSGTPNDATVTVIETPSSCWDLRVADAGCRTSITATFSSAVTDQPDPATPTTTPPTTTPPDNTQPARAEAAPAPAPTPAPAPAVVDEPAFTG